MVVGTVTYGCTLNRTYEFTLAFLAINTNYDNFKKTLMISNVKYYMIKAPMEIEKQEKNFYNQFYYLLLFNCET